MPLIKKRNRADTASYIALPVHYIRWGSESDVLIEQILMLERIDRSSHRWQHFCWTQRHFWWINNNKISFVTDRGANIKKVLCNNTRFNCADHLVHKIVKKKQWILCRKKSKFCQKISFVISRKYRSICKKIKKSLRHDGHQCMKCFNRLKKTCRILSQ